jgi:hypothetical protein
LELRSLNQKKSDLSRWHFLTRYKSGLEEGSRRLANRYVWKREIPEKIQLSRNGATQPVRIQPVSAEGLLGTGIFAESTGDSMRTYTSLQPRLEAGDQGCCRKAGISPPVAGFTGAPD